MKRFSDEVAKCNGQCSAAYPNAFQTDLAIAILPFMAHIHWTETVIDDNEDDCWLSKHSEHTRVPPLWNTRAEP